MGLEEECKKLYKLTDIVKILNEGWRRNGQSGTLSISSDDIEVTESEVVMKFRCVMTVTISKDKVDLSSLEAVNPAVNQSSSETIKVT